MEITQLKYFLEVAKTQHITQSAQRLHIAQPALSQSIKRLENELGVQLFEKNGRNIILTKYGEYLKNELIPMIDKLDSLPKTLQKMANLDNDTIHINVLAASTIITDAIIEYESTHTGINFQLLQSEQQNTPDIEITTEISHIANGDNQFVIPEKIFLAVPNNEKYSFDTVSLSDIADEQFISLMGSKQFRYICDKFCHRAGINPHIVFESDSPSAVKNMIGASLGIGFWPEFTWGNVDNDKVKLLKITNPNCQRDIIITCNPSKMQNKNVTEFFNFLKQYILERKEKES